MSPTEFFQNFGIPGLLLGVAWLFWNKWTTFAKVIAIMGAALALVTSIFEVQQRWLQSPRLEVSPQLSPRPWAGFFEDGSPVASVTAKLVRNGAVLDSFSVPGLDIGDRSLNVQRIDDSWLRVKWQGNPQGRLSSSVLEQDGFRRVPNSAFLTPRWIAVSEVTDGTQHIAVRSDAAKRVKFSDLSASIDRFAPEDDGVVVSVYGDGDSIDSSLIRRADDAPEGRRQLQFTYGGNRYGLQILFLSFQSPPDIPTNRATLLFVRY